MKLGRLPRKRDPRVPHLSALLAGRRGALAPPPASCDYTAALPASLGAFLNDQLGDCTCAGLYHALQVWSANASPPIDTQPDSSVLSLYESACGYVQGNAQTDQGGVEQDVLAYAMLAGLPVNEGNGRHRISAYIEVDPSNFADVKLAIYSAGIAYFGLNLPDYCESTQTWDVQPGEPKIVGGHCVISAGYDADGLNVITWGSKAYRMTWGFLAAFCDEAYMIADADWIKSTGVSPAGLSLLDLETQMQALRSAGLSDNSGRIIVPPFAPTGLSGPIPHNPQLLEARAQRDAAQATAAKAQGDAQRAAAHAAEFQADRDKHAARATELEVDRDQHCAKAQELGQLVEQLKGALASTESQRDELLGQVAALRNSAVGGPVAAGTAA